MDDFETKSKTDEAFGDYDQNAMKRKSKGWSVLYLPAFFIAAITIALLFLMIFGTLFGNYQASDSNSVLLHTIDFTVSEASFNSSYSYLPSAAEDADFIVGQGFRWDTLDSQIRVNVPNYENNLSLVIAFGAFNAKTYDSILDNQTSYVVTIHSADDAIITSNDIEGVNQGAEKTIDIVSDTVSYLLISYVHPITAIDEVEVMGFLYLKNISLYQISD